KLHQSVEPAIEKNAEQAAELPVGPTHRMQRRAHPAVEREVIEPVDVRVETGDVVWESLADGAPVELGEHRPCLVRIGRRRGGRVRRRARAAAPGARPKALPPAPPAPPSPGGGAPRPSAPPPARP